VDFTEGHGVDSYMLFIFYSSIAFVSVKAAPTVAAIRFSEASGKSAFIRTLSMPPESLSFIKNAISTGFIYNLSAVTETFPPCPAFCRFSSCRPASPSHNAGASYSIICRVCRLIPHRMYFTLHPVAKAIFRINVFDKPH
jgi:hypothetical protein